MGYIAIDADSLNSLVYAGMSQNSPMKYLDALLTCARMANETLVFTDRIINETTRTTEHAKDDWLDIWLAHPDNQQGTCRPATETVRKLARGERVKNPGEESIMDFRSDIGEPIIAISDDKRFWPKPGVTWHSTQGILAALVRSGDIAQEDAVAAIKHLKSKGRAKTTSPNDDLGVLTESATPDAAGTLTPQPQD